MKTSIENSVIFSVLIFMLAIATSSCSKDTSSNELTKATKIAPGYYLQTKYIDSVRATFSTLKATVPDNPQFLAIFNKDGKLYLRTIFGFREGGAEFYINSDGSLNTKLAAGYNTKNAALVDLGNDKIKFSFDAFSPTEYVKIDNAESYIESLVLYGKYQDSNGKQYIFGNDGVAKFPDTSFHYKIGLDHIGIPFDYFTKTESGEIIAFKRTIDGLTLWETTTAELPKLIETKKIELRKIR